jgi:hypothetical protein
MTKKTRFFVLSSALVLMVGLGTGLLAYYGGLPTLASGRAAGPDELKYVPSSASIVAFANVREVMSSDFRQSLRMILPDHDKSGQDKFKEATGIDVEQDIDHVVACVSQAGAADNQGFVMLRGRFDNGRLEATAVSHGAKVEDYQGTRIVRVTHGNGSSSSILAFVEPGLLMFGDEMSVKRALGRQEGSVTTNDEMMGMIADVDEGNANLWAVGRVETLAKNAHLPEQIQAQMPGVKWFSASSRINGGLSGTLRAEAQDDAAAKNLREVVQGFLALAKLQAGSKPEMTPLLDSIQLSGSGRTVALSFQVPSEFIQSVSGKAKAAIE